MFERRLYYHVDWAMLGAILALCALGVATIYSATFDPTRGASHRYITQVYAIALGLVAMMFMLTLDYRTFTDKSHLIYIAIILVLVYVLFSGKEMKGARRWIMLKASTLQLQPSEFAKIGVALKGKPKSDEARRRMSESAKRRCERQRLTSSQNSASLQMSLPL